MKSKNNKAYLLSLNSRLRRAVLLYDKQKKLLEEIFSEIVDIISEINTLKGAQQIFYWNATKSFNDKTDNINE